MESPDTAFVWGIVANITMAPDGQGRLGTKHFRAGAKVILDTEYQYIYHGHEGLRVSVFGQHRKSARWIQLIMPLSRLTHLRMKRLYAPQDIVQALRAQGYDHSTRSQSVREQELALLLEKIAAKMV